MQDSYGMGNDFGGLPKWKHLHLSYEGLVNQSLSGDAGRREDRLGACQAIASKMNDMKCTEVGQMTECL